MNILPKVPHTSLHFPHIGAGPALNRISIASQMARHLILNRPYPKSIKSISSLTKSFPGSLNSLPGKFK